MLVRNSKKWSYVKISEICDFRGGGTPSKQEPNYWNGKINWASVKDIKGDYLETTQEFITPLGLKNSATSLAKPGDLILITRISPGKTILSKIETAINQDLKIIIPKVKTHPKFLHYYFQSIQKKIIDLSNGTTVLGITLNSLNEIEIPRLSFEEQQSIVSKIEELFSELDKGIESLRLAQQQLRVYRQSVLKWAFEGRLTNENVKEGELPEGWKWIKLGEACHDVEYGSASKSQESGKVPVLRMGNIQNGRFDWTNLVYTNDADEIKKYLLKKNDVLFNRTNSAELVGKTAIYKGKRPAIFAGYLIRINRKEELLDGDYLTYFLNTHFAKSYGNTVRSFGVNQSNINGTKLKPKPCNSIDLI